MLILLKSIQHTITKYEAENSEEFGIVARTEVSYGCINS